MKPSQFKYYCVILQLILMGACAPKATPSPAASEPPTPALVSVDLAGPKMEVGSTFLYADGTTLVAVPAGSFTMGGAVPDNLVHQVNLSDFWIYSTKVTNRQYGYCVAIGLCTPPLARADNPAFDDPLGSNDPMVGVDYAQATAYCSFAHARLPTDAEWEKAARGPDGNTYPWGDGAPNCDLLNYGICVGDTTPVTTYPAGRSYYQAFDMAGNALEWVTDWYQADYYVNAPAENPTGPDEGRERVVRSSAFNSGGDQIPVFTRSHSSPDTHRNNLGFRCVVDDPAYFAPFCEIPATYGTDGVGGTSTGDQLQVSCPTISIYQNKICVGEFPRTLVTFEGSAHFASGYSSPFAACEENTINTSFEEGDLICKEAGILFICSRCSVSLTAPAQCPDGYTYDGASKNCIGQASPGQCLPGFTPDEADTGGQCCTLEPGSPALSTTPIAPAGTFDLKSYQLNHATHNCPAGTWVLTDPDGNKSCIPVAVDDPYCKQEWIAFKDCTPGPDIGGNEDPGGGCPAQSCNAGFAWDPATCTCVCDGC